MKQLTLLFLLYLGVTTQAQNNFGYLDINQVKAGINSNGNLHDSPVAFRPEYEVPKGSGKHATALTNLWFGGMHNNQLHLSAQFYAISPQDLDFNSGPLTVSGTCLVTDSAKYMKVWKLNQTDINDFISNYANGNVQNGSYIPVPDLMSWPGNGDITKNQSGLLAPFMDVNGDARYTPMDGDYPLIKGDQALYFIYNDVTALPHGSGGASLGLEVHGMAYAYSTCSVVIANPVLDYTTFYDYEVINRSTNTYTDFHIGLHSEAALGQYIDDYIGCDVKDNYAYVYNADANDETGGGAIGYGANPPATAFVMLRSPESSSDGIDNDADGVIDETGEQMGMTNFSYFFVPLAGVPAAVQLPSVASEYYSYMHSTWKDGTPFTCDSPDGYGGTVATPYLFPGTSYTNSPCGTAGWSETMAPGNRRYAMSTKQATFQPGEVIRLTYAHVTSFDPSGNALAKLDQDVNTVKTFYQSGASVSCMATGIQEQNDALAFALYPNPASSQLTLTFDKALTAGMTATVNDVYGKVLLSAHNEDRETIHLDINALASGIYFVKLSADGKSSVKKFIKQ